MAQLEVPERTIVVVGEHLPVAKDALTAAKDFEIRTAQDFEFAAVLLKEVKANFEAIENERKKIAGPLHQAWTATNDLFRPVTSALASAESVLKKKIAEYQRAQREQNMRALQVAATDKAAFEKLELVSSHAPVGISTRTVWKFEVTDPGAVPREFCSPDPKKIGAVNPGTPIAGVRWFEEDVVSARKK